MSEDPVEAPPGPMPPANEDPPALSTRPRREPCWICGSATIDVHCKIVCPRCGFRRDCSDP